jgi:protein tyrosine/serine phosphatase
MVMWTLLCFSALSCGGQPGDASQSDTAQVSRNKKPAALAAPKQTSERNPKWALPMEKPGLPNLHEVAPNIYRGAQPLPEGFKSLKQMGVKTVINFRNFHSDVDEMEAAGVKDAFQYTEIPMNTWDMTDERAAKFLSLVEDDKNLPVFYHCQHGADRTGTMTAVYRIAHQGWTIDEALDEMQNGGFGYHEIWTNLISYLKKFDVKRVRDLRTF